MPRIIVSEDCGNSPKNNLILQFTIAVAKRDFRFILDKATENLRWDFVGGQSIEGKENLIEFLKGVNKDEVAILNIHHVVSHGKAGAVDGTQKYKNGKMAAFCNVYEFENAKGALIAEITTYLLQAK